LPYKEILFVLLGDGKEKPALMKQAAEMGLTNLLFLPPLPKSSMPQALAAADACLAVLQPLPLYSTVYPNKVFDYMAAGRPVLLAIDGVIREVVEGAQAGLFVAPGDPESLATAVLQLACDPALCRQMGLNARRCVEERFDRAQLAEKFARLVEELVGEKN
jgi:glycosyltransferase involved in cell wall biosynthesis